MHIFTSIKNKLYPIQLYKSTLCVYITKEYHLATFVLTVDYLIKSTIYQKSNNIIIDFTDCQDIHGTGMGLEIQLFYEKAKENSKKVYWSGNYDIYKITYLLNEYGNTETVPYL